MTDSARPWFFDLWSGFYDQTIVQRIVYRPVHDAVLTRLRDLRPRRVLDLGCGTGLLSERIRAELDVEAVIGADYSSGMLSQARASARGDAWAQANALALPFASGAFDAIVSTEAFHWFPDQQQALGECRRVLRPGGSLLVAFVNPWFESTSAIIRAASQLAGQPARWPTRPQMRSMLEAAGFEVREQVRVFRPFGLLIPPVLSVAVRQ